MRRSAVISDCERYRYLLERSWPDVGGVGTCAFVMLNPSTADDATDDPTLTRCIGFAQRWGFGRLLVVNAYALRATDPSELRRRGMTQREAVGGKETDEYLRVAAATCDRLVLAWGTLIDDWRAGELIVTLERAVRDRASVCCLGRNAGGSPKHPLYLAAATMPEPWRVASSDPS